MYTFYPSFEHNFNDMNITGCYIRPDQSEVNAMKILEYEYYVYHCVAVLWFHYAF